MRVVTIPCLADNYAYLVVDEASGQAAVVDPSEAAPVVEAVAREGVTLRAIWCTHHHWDHTGGNTALLERWPDLAVVGGAFDGKNRRIPGQTVALDDGGETALAGLSARALHVPGHTLGALTYVVEDAAFTGDTLFLAGCGRLFEGTAKQMHASLGRLASLPGATRVFPGHEYTVKNLEFALAADPASAAVARRLAEAKAARDRGRPTVPATLAEELATNPFLRAPDADDFARLRTWKDQF